MPDVPLRCRCGELAGLARDVSPSGGFRFVCYCEHCRGFAQFLGTPGVLDAAGGTDIFHMPPARVRFAAGLDQLRCVQLTPKVLRWYTACCRTPVANTGTSPRFPVVAVIHPVMDLPSRDAVLGPPLCRIFERSATGPLPPDAPPPATARMFVRRGISLVRWRLRGLHRPNPFFDHRDRPRHPPSPL